MVATPLTKGMLQELRGFADARIPCEVPQRSYGFKAFEARRRRAKLLCRLGLIERVRPDWSKGVRTYIITAKGLAVADINCL